MESTEHKRFYVVQTQGSFRNEIGEMSEMAVYAHLRTRLGNDMATAEAVLESLERNGAAAVRFNDSLGIENHIEIRRIENCRVGDEIVEPGIVEHKRIYVGPIGPNGEDVVDPAKGQPAGFVHLSSIPNRGELTIGMRGPQDLRSQLEIQGRARSVVANGVVNRTWGPNCEHITSFIRNGQPKSPQLLAGFAVAAELAVAAGSGTT